MKGDVLWMGKTKALVAEVDPIRGMIKVTLGTDLEVEVGPEELTKRKPQQWEERKKKRKERKEREEEGKGRVEKGDHQYNTTAHSYSTTSHPYIWRP